MMKIAVIGAGNMGGATVHGLLKSHLLKAGDIQVANPSVHKLEAFAERGVKTFTNNKEAIQNADVVMLFVKPWLVESVIQEIKPSLDYEKQILVIVAAGVSSHSLKEWLTKEQAVLPPLFLCIPNIAIAELSSMTFLVPVFASEKQTQLVMSIFDALGTTLIIEERLLPAGTTLASCGLAYAMRYVRASSEGGVELGFRPDDAKNIVLQTMKGVVSLLQANGNHPEAEIDKVTTPGGLTIKGLNEMEHAGFSSAVIRGLKAGIK